MQIVQWSNLQWCLYQNEEYRRRDSNQGNLFIKADEEGWFMIPKDNYAIDLWVSNAKKADITYEMGGSTELQKKSAKRNIKLDKLVGDTEI